MSTVRGILSLETVRGLLLAGALAGLLLGPTVMAVRWLLAQSGVSSADSVPKAESGLPSRSTGEGTRVAPSPEAIPSRR